jgi:hypothetical protein
MNRTLILPAVLLCTLWVNAQAAALEQSIDSPSESSLHELIECSEHVGNAADHSSNDDATSTATCQVNENNKSLSVHNTSERAQIQTLAAFLSDTLIEADDQQLIWQLLTELSRTRISGALTIRGPQDAYFYFENRKSLSRELSRSLGQVTANTVRSPKSQINAKTEFSQKSQMLPDLEQLMDPSSSLLSMQPARLKAIRMPFFSPVSGHRIASLRFKSISTMYKSFGPFRIPITGAMLEGAELMITKP